LYLDFHTHKDTNSLHTLELVNKYPEHLEITTPFYSIGIHPWFIDLNKLEEELSLLTLALKNKNCLAIGEIGLDKRAKTNFNLQQMVFEQQLILAQEYHKPVIIHCVASFDEIIRIRKKLTITIPMIFHGFSKNDQLARQLVAQGFYLSFGKKLLDQNYKSVFRSIPNDRFFLETDNPETNDKRIVSIEYIYALAAEYKNIELKELKEIILKNGNSVFGNFISDQIKK
jgi:TatD DNase family protein